MADVDAGAADVEQQPKPKPKPAAKAKGGGSMGTIIAAVIAVAAIGMCAFLFMQVASLKQQLGDNVPQPAGVAGVEGEHGDDVAANGHGGGDAPGVRADPLKRYYPLGEFKANTADGKYASMDITLELKCWYSRAEYDAHNSEMEMYDLQFKHYVEALQEFNDKAMKKLHGAVFNDHEFVRAGLALAVHSAPVEEVAPEPPVKPSEPRTVLENKLDERTPVLRDHIITLINSHNAADIISLEGKAAFKQNIIDSLNAMFHDDDVGEIEEVLLNDFITT